MVALLSRRTPLIGVDFDGRFIRAAQGVRGARGWRLEAALALPRAAAGTVVDRRDVEQLAGALRRQGFKGNRLVLAVPEDKLVTGILELPPRTSGAPVEEIARTELAGMHGYDPQAAETVCWDLPPSGRLRDTTPSMAVACRHADAEALLESFEGSGLDVQALDSHPHALVRAARPLLAAEGTTAILDVEWDWAVLVLLHRGTVIYKWTMPEACVGHLVKALSAALGLEEDAAASLLAEVGLASPPPDDSSPYDAVAALIRKHLDKTVAAMQSPFAYSCQQYPGSAVDCVFLAGCGAAVPGGAEYLQGRLGATVRTLLPKDLVRCPAALGAKAADPSLAVPIGLAQFVE